MVNVIIKVGRDINVKSVHVKSGYICTLDPLARGPLVPNANGSKVYTLQSPKGYLDGGVARLEA